VKNIDLQVQGQQTPRGMVYMISGFDIGFNGVLIMLWLMKLIFVVGVSNIIGLENDNVVKLSYNLSIMFVTLLYNNIFM
jgi:hypothetical protein